MVRIESIQMLSEQRTQFRIYTLFHIHKYNIVCFIVSISLAWQGMMGDKFPLSHHNRSSKT